MRFPIRKYVYFSDDALEAIREGDEDMIEYYKEFLLDEERIFKMDVCLLTDAYFKPLPLEHKKFLSSIKRSNVCKEIVVSSRLDRAIDKLNNMSHEEYTSFVNKT